MKKAMTRLLLSALLILGGFTLYCGLNLLVTNDGSSMTRITFHDFYEAEQVDTLFLGTSHAVYGIHAARISEGTGENVYSLATSAQNFPGSYYVLKDALGSKQIRKVYFELSQSQLLPKKDDTTRVFIISDYLRSPAVRARYLLTELKAENYLQAFFRLRRNLDPLALPTLESMGTVYDKNNSPEYRSFTPRDSYLGRGSWENTRRIDSDGTVAINYADPTLSDFGVDRISDESLDWLQRIIDLCREKQVELTIFISPYHEFYIQNFRQYRQVTEAGTAVAERNGIPVVDLNLVKDEYLKLGNSDYSSLDHINVSGGEKVSDFLVTYMLNPDGDYFCGSLEEKYPHVDTVRYAGYQLSYLNADGEERTDAPYAKNCRAKLVFSAIGYREIPVDARLWKAAREPNGGWALQEEIPGEKLDACHVQFIFPYSGKDDWYVQLLEPDTGEILYETPGSFR